MKQLKIKGGFIPMLLGILAASMLGGVLTTRGVKRAGEGTIRASENFLCRAIL